MEVSDLRIALFSGNYNMTTDGANKALNRLVGYLLAHGAAVRVYSPTVANPDFEPTGDLVSVPSVAIPGRSEYRIPVSFSSRVREDITSFAPNVVHISSPDRVARQAAAWARRRKLPVACSVHTRFETYVRYYNLSFLEPLAVAWLRKLYRKCDALIAPSESFAQVLREQRMNYDIGIWTRGVEQEIFNPARRDMAWRRSLARELAERPLDDIWVLVGAAVAVLLGLWLLVLAATPGLRDVLPMRRVHPHVRAGLHRDAAALALRDRAMEVSGVRSVRVRAGRKRVDVRAVSHFRELDDVRADLDVTLADGIRGLGLARPPALSVHVRRPGRKG